MGGTKVWYKSTEFMGALAGIAGGIVALSHFCCLYFGWCILEKVSEAEWVLLLSALATIGAGVYWLIKRIAAGNDPNNPTAKITLTEQGGSSANHD